MTVIGSDFDYKNVEFTSQAIGNRNKRHMKITPIMKWEFSRDLIRMKTKIQNMKHAIDNVPPKRPASATVNKHRQQLEESRLLAIEKENREMLDRLRKIHNRPRSFFCHMKTRNDPLVKGDAFTLPPPSGKGLYLVQMYNKLKLANHAVARKSIRVQQEMLTSAIELVQASTKVKPSQEEIENLVQKTLTAVDEVPLAPDVDEINPYDHNQSIPLDVEEISLVELVRLANPLAHAQPPDDFAAVESLPSTNATDTSEVASSDDNDGMSDNNLPQSTNETPIETPCFPQSTNETPYETPI